MWLHNAEVKPTAQRVKSTSLRMERQEAFYVMKKLNMYNTPTHSHSDSRPDMPGYCHNKHFLVRRMKSADAGHGRLTSAPRKLHFIIHLQFMVICAASYWKCQTFDRLLAKTSCFDFLTFDGVRMPQISKHATFSGRISDRHRWSADAWHSVYFLVSQVHESLKKHKWLNLVKRANQKKKNTTAEAPQMLQLLTFLSAMFMFGRLSFRIHPTKTTPALATTTQFVIALMFLHSNILFRTVNRVSGPRLNKFPGVKLWHARSIYLLLTAAFSNQGSIAGPLLTHTPTHFTVLNWLKGPVFFRLWDIKGLEKRL